MPINVSSACELAFRRALFMLIVLFVYLIFGSAFLRILSFNLAGDKNGQELLQRLDFKRSELLNVLWAESIGRSEHDWSLLANQKLDAYEKSLLHASHTPSGAILTEDDDNFESREIRSFSQAFHHSFCLLTTIGSFRKQWANLVKKFKTEKKKIDKAKAKPSGSGAKQMELDYQDKWDLYDDMLFIETCIAERPEHSSSLSVSKDDGDNENEYDHERDVESPLFDSPRDSPAFNSSRASPAIHSDRASPALSRKRKNRSGDVDEAILQALRTINTSASDLSPLAQSVEDIFKRISATGDKKNLLAFKKDIQKLLDEYDEWLVDNE